MMIESFRNPLVKRIKRLKQKKHRQREGAFFVDGIRSVASAIEAGAAVETLICSSDLLSSDFGRNLIQSTHIPTTEVSADVFKNISDRENPSGLAAIIAQTQRSLADLNVGPNAVFVALYDIADPGNLGTIIRTVDAAGTNGVILMGNTTDPYHPNAVKASMGALFAVDVVSGVDSAETILQWANTNSITTVATSAKAKASYKQLPQHKPLILMMGSERQGLPAEITAACDLAVTIPMRGVSSSLNLAVATAILLYQAQD